MKRTIFSTLAFVLCAVFVLSTIACNTPKVDPSSSANVSETPRSSEAPATSEDPDAFRISSSQLVLLLNESTVLRSNDTENTKWKSDNNDVARTDDKGNVYALKKGSCVITAENGKGESLECKVTVLDPADCIKLPDLKSLTLKQSKIDEEIKKEYEYMADYFAEKKEADEDRVIENKDIASISYSGILAGETDPFEGGTGVYDLEIGSKSFIDGFEDGLVGHKAGETVTLNLTFPEDYVDPAKDPERAAKFNGKAVVFTVTINKVYLMIPAQINDELISQATKEQFKTVNDYTAYLQEQLSEYLTLEEVISACEITSYPDELVKYYNEIWISNNFGMYAQYYGMTAVEFACRYYGYTEEQLYEEATKSSKAYIEQLLVVYSIIAREDFSVPEESKNTILSDYAASGSFESVDELIKEAGEGYIDNYVANEYAIILLREWVKIVDDTVTEN